jgi:WD40 repeat protein
MNSLFERRWQVTQAWDTNAHSVDRLAISPSGRQLAYLTSVGEVFLLGRSSPLLTTGDSAYGIFGWRDEQHLMSTSSEMYGPLFTWSKHQTAESDLSDCNRCTSWAVNADTKTVTYVASSSVYVYTFTPVARPAPGESALTHKEQSFYLPKFESSGIYVVGSDRTLARLDPSTGTVERMSLPEDENGDIVNTASYPIAVKCIAWGGTHLLALTETSVVRLDPDGTVHHHLSWPSDALNLQVSPDGRYIASVRPGGISIGEPKTGKPAVFVSLPSEVNDLAIGPRGVFVALIGGQIAFISRSLGKGTTVPSRAPSPPFSMSRVLPASSPRQLARAIDPVSGSTIDIDVDTGHPPGSPAPRCLLEMGEAAWGTATALHPSGNIIATTHVSDRFNSSDAYDLMRTLADVYLITLDGTRLVGLRWDIPQNFYQNRSRVDLTFDPTGNYLAVTETASSVIILDVPTLRIIRRITATQRCVSDLQFSCCGRYLSVCLKGEKYNRYEIYSTVSGRLISKSSSEEILLGDKHFLEASKGYDLIHYKYRPFNENDMPGSIEARPRSDQEQCFAASADGETLAWILRNYRSDGSGTSIALWDRRTRRYRIRILPFRPQGRWAISTGGHRIVMADDWSLRTFDLIGNQYQERLQPYHTRPSPLALSADGEICLASNKHVFLLGLPNIQHLS